MPEDKSTLLVPLRSNGSTLVAGAPVAAFRRRLKYASILFDQLLLEGGVLRLNAGPSLSFSVVELFNPQAPARWQTATARHAAEKNPFQLAIGKEDTPGVPPAIMHPAGYSETSISWVATLYPFAGELPPGTDWMEFVKSPDPVGSVKQLADQWSWTDERNPSLEQTMPVRFVRNTVIKNVNRDLALATASGFAAVIDPFHQRVVTQRFNDDGWNMRGYAVPVIFPAVGDWSWSAIADLRRDPNMVRFRAVLREVEEEAAAEAASGDIEVAVHHVYEKHLASAVSIDKITTPVRHTAGGLVISLATGVATSGISGPGGLMASTILGTAIGGVLDARAYVRQRRSRGWVAVHKRLRGD